MQLKKYQFVLCIVGAFLAGTVLTGSVAAFQMNGGGASKGGDSKISELYEYIDNYYYTDYDEDDLINGAYKGFVQGLGDPYSAYMTKEEYDSWNVSVTGEYSGVGITFTENDDGEFVVLAINKNSPAKKAGIKEGDVLLTVDGKTYDSSDSMAVAIRGKKGSKVTLEYSREGDIKKVEMIRDNISQESVEYEMLEGDVGYIAITQFIDHTSEDFQKALSALEKQGAKSLVLDLRDNGGGLVDECVEIADAFLDKGVVCYVKDKDGSLDSYDAKDGKTKLKTVVLINENSASAAEILSAALKDNGFTIVGQTSFGKGVIQTTVEFDDGSALKLTIMQYLSPDKKVIHGKGVAPNIKCTDKESTEKDEQLEKALQSL